MKLHEKDMSVTLKPLANGNRCGDINLPCIKSKSWVLV